MKIYLNRRPIEGPWGGGSKILRAIVNESTSRGHEVLFEEQHSKCEKVDVILCVDPRPTQVVNYGDLVYLKERSKCSIVQRVGDLGTHGKPELTKLVFATTNHSDYLVFPSEWARETLGVKLKKSVVIVNGADPRFKEKRRPIKSHGGSLKIVTHHWSDNQMKGFEIYERLSSYCAADDMKFTYIGRKPQETRIENYVRPLDVSGLSDELPRHDVYVTASRQEAGANHVLEAMACGLPVLFHIEGGSIVEYCKTRGISYRSFEELLNILKNRRKDVEDIAVSLQYDRTTEDVGREYVDLLESIREGKHQHR